MNRKKNRNLSPIDYLKVLIDEYFKELLLCKIHYSPKNKRYHKNVAEYKLVVISDLCEKKKLLDPTENPKDWQESISKQFNIMGIEHWGLTQEQKFLYFMPNNDFFCVKDGVEKCVKSKQFNFLTNVLTVVDEGEKIFDVGISDVRRIL